MITRRDLIVAGIAVGATAAVMALAQPAAKPVMHSSVFNWNNMSATNIPTGERRNVFDAPTPTVSRLECHISTLNPGLSPHTPHKHPEEEVMILREGTLEVMQNDQTNRVEAGGIIFCASNEIHGMRNVGSTPATYFVVKYFPHDLPK
jgi:XRE family transcriptional regulator, regulator of sulfur utilization